MQNINLPPKLYRYSSFNEDITQVLDVNGKIMKEQEKWKCAIFDGFVYPSSPFYFNDPYDCDLCIEYSFLNNEETKNVMIDMVKRNCKIEPYDINRLKYSTNLIKDVKIVLSHYVKLKDNFDDIIDETLKQFGSDVIKRLLRVICFTIYYDSILMWSHYAKNHTGFCIEYNTSYLHDVVKPVKYSGARASVNENSLKQTGWVIEAALTKSSVWSYESEWRIVIPDITNIFPNIFEEHLDLKNAVNAVYLGAKTDHKYISEITHYYNDTNIPIYQMKMSYNEYKLQYVKI